MGQVAAYENDTGGQKGADHAGRPGAGPGGGGGHPAAAGRERLGADGKGVLAELGGVPPETIIRRQQGSRPVFFRDVVEFVLRFDHALRISKQVPLGASGRLPRMVGVPSPGRRGAQGEGFGPGPVTTMAS